MFTKSTLIAFLIGITGHAGNDPTIKGAIRTGIQEAMNSHIKANQVDSKYLIFDGKNSKLLRLNPVKLHDGIVKKGDFYVSCADFTDDSDRKLDVDLVVSEQDGNFMIVDTIVHKIGQNKRPYTLEKDAAEGSGHKRTKHEGSGHKHEHKHDEGSSSHREGS